MKIYVGNLAYSCTDEDLTQLFSDFGAVEKAYVVKDRESQRSKGFGFVEMASEGGETAIQELNGKDFLGRNINVSVANPAPQGGDRGGPRRRPFGGGGGNGGPRRDGGGNGGPRRSFGGGGPR